MPHALSKACLSLALALALHGAPAAAQPGAPGDDTGTAGQGTRIVLVVGAGMEEIGARFAAELDSLHLDVVRVPDASAPPSTEELGALARHHQARVGVRVTRSGGAFDLWLVNPESQEVIYRRVVADGDAAVAVLRSLEILRGALVDLDALAPEPEVAPPAERTVGEERNERETPPPKEQLAPPAAWLGLSAAAAAAHAGRGVGGGVSAGVYSQVASRFALRADVFAPVTGWDVHGQGGSARVWIAAATAGALVTPWGEAALTPGLGLGMGLLAVSTLGQAAPGYQGSDALYLAAFPHGRVELAVSLSGSVRFRAAVLPGFAVPRPVLIFADDKEEDWLNPLFLSSAGIEVALP